MALARIDVSEFESLVKKGEMKTVTLTGKPEGWTIIASYSSTNAELGAKRGHARAFRTMETASSFLSDRGVTKFLVDTSKFDSSAFRAARRRPDRAEALKQTHEDAAHTEWFRAQVEVGRADVAAGRVSSADDVFDRLTQRAERIRAARRGS